MNTILYTLPEDIPPAGQFFVMYRPRTEVVLEKWVAARLELVILIGNFGLSVSNLPTTLL